MNPLEYLFNTFSTPSAHLQYTFSTPYTTSLYDLKNYDAEREKHEFFADLFANNNYPLKPFDYNTDVDVKTRLDAIENAEINLKKALKR